MRDGRVVGAAATLLLVALGACSSSSSTVSVAESTPTVTVQTPSAGSIDDATPAVPSSTATPSGPAVELGRNGKFRGGDVVTVTIHGFASEEEVVVAVCALGPPTDLDENCGIRKEGVRKTVSVDSSGSAFTQVTIPQDETTTTGRAIRCPPCVVRAWSVDDPTKTAFAMLNYARVVMDGKVPPAQPGPAGPMPSGVVPATASTIVGRWEPLALPPGAERGKSFIRVRPDGSWHGADGCNGNIGRWSMGVGGSLAATAGPQTLIACQGVGVPMDFANAWSAGFAGSTLLLFDPTGEVTRLRRAT